jgi:hypothetical protein
MRGNQT